MANNTIKVAMITGYLGAGKTTLLNHILTNTEGIRAAVIVNDIGEVNVDADLIASSGALTTVDDTLIPMTNGCICCSLSEDLENQLRSIANSGNFDYIIIEASGVCEPMPIAYTISAFFEENTDEDTPMELDNVIAVVDAARMFDEFNGGKALLEEGIEETDIEGLLIQQIEFCSTLILNKADQVTPEQMGELRALVRSLQREAKIIEATKCAVDLDEILNTGLFTFEGVFDSAVWVDAMTNSDKYEDDSQEEHGEGEHHHDEECCSHGHDHDHHHDHEEECCGHHHDHDHHYDDDCCCHDREHDHDEEGHEEGHHHHHHHHGPNCTCGCNHDHLADYGISTFIYDRRRPFSHDALNAVIEKWPEGIIRAKGLLWYEGDDYSCYLFEQAGKRFYLEENGPWAAVLPEEELNEVRKTNPEVFEDWDPEVGDRRTKLVFIGKNMNKQEIIDLLDSYIS
ncbi:MAG: CobW family GTP-binding protein [Anaerotardibacter sp.]